MKRLAAWRAVLFGTTVARWDTIAAVVACTAAVWVGAAAIHAWSAGTLAPSPIAALAAQGQVTRLARFQSSEPSPDVRAIANWVAESQDNGQRAFAILDKRNARLYVFNRDASLVDSSRVLLGSALGDETAPGVGDKPLAQVRASERTTPAGRFVSEPGHDSAGDDVIWVDYDSALAMHRIHEYAPSERRFERIETPSAADKRISNGCINVPAAFYDAVVKARLGTQSAVVYVLPELKTLRETFAGFR